MLPSNLYRARGRTPPNAWISLCSFGRIETFQWVTAKKIKKLPLAELASQVVKIVYKRGAIILSICLNIADREFVSAEQYAIYFWICQ
jgi:hypothetical protein